MATEQQKKHTPGPWEVSSSSGIVKVQGPADKPKYKRREVCRVYSSKENAFLLAAAPDLLEVCLAMLEFFDNGTPVQPGAEVVADMRAAVAKAKGQQQ